MASKRLNLIGGESAQALHPVSSKLGEFQIDFWEECHGRAGGVWGLRIRAGNWEATWWPTRGMGLAEVRVDERRFGWESPVRGPVNPCWVPLSEPSGLGWLDGFDELLVRCGLTSNGAPQFSPSGTLELPLHGRIANLPVERLELALLPDGRLELISEVIESRFHFGKWQLITRAVCEAGRPWFSVEDRIVNRGGSRQDFQMLYHFNLGRPLLEPGGQIHVPVKQLVPRDAVAASQLSEWNRIGSPQSGFAEEVYFVEPQADPQGNSLAVLTNAAGDSAARIGFQTAMLPCLSLWRNFADPRDGYVVGLEPATNFPNTKRFEAAQGRTVWLDAGASTSLNWDIEFTHNARLITDWVERVATIQGGQAGQFHSRPLAGWCEIVS